MCNVLRVYSGDLYFETLWGYWLSSPGLLTGFVGLCEANPDLFLSHFLILTFFYPIIEGLDCYCCT